MGSQHKTLRAKTYKDLYDALDECQSRSLEEVAAKVGSTPKAVYVRLLRLYQRGEIARDICPGDPRGGRPIYHYRLLPRECDVAPLYDRKKGYDALALSRCLGGLGYNVKSNQVRE